MINDQNTNDHDLLLESIEIYPVSQDNFPEIKRFYIQEQVTALLEHSLFGF